jgi:hypothetical protein
VLEPARFTFTATVPADSATDCALVAIVTPRSSLVMVTTATVAPAPSTMPPVGVERVTLKVSGPSIAVSFSTPTQAPAVVVGPTLIVLAEPSPAAQESVPVFCTVEPLVPKSLPASAVPFEVVHLTVAAVAADPVRVTVSVPLGPASLTPSVVGAKPTVLSLSVIVTVATLVGPRRAPPVGFESVIVKSSLPSTTVSLRVGIVAVVGPTVKVLAPVTPAAQERVPVRCVAFPLVPKSCPATAEPLPVVQVTETAPADAPERFTVTVTLGPASFTV